MESAVEEIKGIDQNQASHSKYNKTSNISKSSNERRFRLLTLLSSLTLLILLGSDQLLKLFFLESLLFEESRGDFVQLG